MFSDHQTSLSDRALNLLKMGSQFFANNSEYLKRVVNVNTKKEWQDTTFPLLEPLFQLIEDTSGSARDGMFKSTELLNPKISPFEKMIGNVISKWGRLNEKGHGPEVDKMGPNLEALEGSVHRLENVVVKYINDTKEQERKDAENKRLMQEKMEKMKEEQIKEQERIKQLIKEQEEERIRNPPPPDPLTDPNVSQFDKEVYKIKNQYGDVENIDTDDPNNNIMKSLLDLSSL